MGRSSHHVTGQYGASSHHNRAKPSVALSAKQAILELGKEIEEDVNSSKFDLFNEDSEVENDTPGNTISASDSQMKLRRGIKASRVTLKTPHLCWETCKAWKKVLSRISRPLHVQSHTHSWRKSKGQNRSIIKCSIGRDM